MREIEVSSYVFCFTLMYTLQNAFTWARTKNEIGISLPLESNLGLGRNPPKLNAFGYNESLCHQGSESFKTLHEFFIPIKLKKKNIETSNFSNRILPKYLYKILKGPKLHL